MSSDTSGASPLAPFETKEQAERLVELLMPLNKFYGVVSGAVSEVDGGWRVNLLVLRRRRRWTIKRIISKHAPGRDIQITETSSRPVRH